MRLGASRAYNAVSGDPLEQPLLDLNGSIFTYVNSFKILSSTNANYGCGAMGINPAAGGAGGVLWLSGLEQATGGVMFAVTLPTLAALQSGPQTVGSYLVAPVNPPNLTGGSPAAHNTGCMYDAANARLLLSQGISYPGVVGSTVIATVDTGLTTFGAPCGITDSYYGPQATGRGYAGPMGPVPAIWQPVLGGNAFIAPGFGLNEVEENLCNGSGLCTFDTNSVSSGGGNIPVTPWLYWPYSGPPLPSWGSTTLGGRPNVTASLSGSTLTISAIALTGLVPGVGSYLLCAAITGVGAAVISAPIAVNADGTGTYAVNAWNGSAYVPGSFSVPTGPMFVSNTATGPCPAYECTSCVTTLGQGGDDLASEYEGPQGTTIFPAGTRTLLQLHIHCYGPRAEGAEYGTCPAGCNQNASGMNDPYRVQLTGWDGAAVYENRMDGGAPNAVLPYQFVSFPGYAALWGSCPGVASCKDPGWAVVDQVNNLLYASLPYLEYGQINVGVWQIGA